MGLIQKYAERELWKRAEAGSGSGLLPDSLLWRMSGRNAGQLLEERSSLNNPQTPLSYPAEWLLDIFNGGRTDSGIRVSEMTALQTDAVLACVQVICRGIASLPLHVFERQMKGTRLSKRIAHDHPMYDMLRTVPNPEMTSNTFRQVVMCHALLWGNSYVEIQRNNAAQPIALWPRNPARTRPVRLTRDCPIQGTLYPKGTLIYHTSETAGDEIAAQDDSANVMAPERIVLAEDMLHIKGLSLDGRLGQSTVYLTRQIIGLALASEKFGAKFFGNGAVPRGILTIPHMLEPKAVENLRRSWQEAHGGENSHKTAVLEAGVKYEPIGIDPEKSQFLATRKYQRVAVASVFSVPPHMIGEGENSKSTVEQSSIEFLTYCLSPWIDAVEQEIKVKLFPIDDARSAPFFAKFDVHKLLYPNADSRSKFYVSGKQWGYLNTNDIHELEDMNPVEDGSGEVYYIGVNMQDAANPMTMPHIGGKQNAAPGPQPEKPLGGVPQNKPVDDEPLASTQSPRGLAQFVTRYERIYRGQFRDAAGRAIGRKALDDAQFRRCFDPCLTAMVESICMELAPEEEEGQLSSADFRDGMEAYMDGMRFNLQGVSSGPETEAWASAESRRAAETWRSVVARAYGDSGAASRAAKDQLRHPDGKFHDGSTDFFIGRHGSTQDDEDGVWSGHRKVGLSDKGKAEVAATAERLKGLGIKRIVTSPLPRAMETAQAYATALGVPLATDDRLAALDLGFLAGKDERKYADLLKTYIDSPDLVIPGGQDSVGGYQRRVNEAFDELQSSNDTTGPILAVAHSSGIALRLARIRNGKGAGDDIEQCSELLNPGGAVKVNGRRVEAVSGKLTDGDAA